MKLVPLLVKKNHKGFSHRSLGENVGGDFPKNLKNIRPLYNLHC